MAELEPAGVKLRRDIARWLACDAGLLTVIEDQDGNPLHLGKRKSSVPPAIRKAVMSRYRTCAWPGCTATAVQMHHTHHRADGGHDDVESIVPECLEHHQLIHTNGIWITIDTNGTVHHWRPDGTEILANPTADHPGTVNALDAPRQAHRPAPRPRRRPRRNRPPTPLARRPLPPRRLHRSHPDPPRPRPPTHPPHPQRPQPQLRTGTRAQPREDGCGGVPRSVLRAAPPDRRPDQPPTRATTGGDGHGTVTGRPDTLDAR